MNDSVSYAYFIPADAHRAEFIVHGSGGCGRSDGGRSDLRGGGCGGSSVVSPGISGCGGGGDRLSFEYPVTPDARVITVMVG